MKGQRIIAYRSSCQPFKYISSQVFFTVQPTTIRDSLTGKALSIQQQIGGSPFVYNSFLQVLYDNVVALWKMEAWDVVTDKLAWSQQMQIPFIDPTKYLTEFEYDNGTLKLTIIDDNGILVMGLEYRIPWSVEGQVYNASLGVVGSGNASSLFIDPCSANITHETVTDIQDVAAYAIPSSTPFPCAQEPAFTSKEGSNLSQAVQVVTPSSVEVLTDTSPYF